MVRWETLEIELAQAEGNRAIVKIMGLLLEEALRLGDEEKKQRLRFWFLYENPAFVRVEQDRVWFSEKSLETLDEPFWVLNRQWNQPITAKRCAQALIWHDVWRHFPVEWIARSSPGAANPWFYAQVGGYLSGRSAGVKPIKLNCWQIGVSQVLRVPCQIVFNLRTLYQELATDMTPGTTTQLALFE